MRTQVTNRWLHVRIIGVVCAVVLVAGACDDDGDDGDASATDPPPVLYEGYTSDVYADPANWICRPDTDDLCEEDLDATVVEADGTLTEEPWEAADDPPIDCFYVYPTISRDETTNSDLVPSEEEEGFATVNQVARLGEVCRVFVPVYRQRTLTALVGSLSGEGDSGEDARDIAYADVADAFKHYMANDNDGRGVVLVGHSQGSGMLNRLIQEEIDPDDAVRAGLVSAFLAGWSVAVPEGEDVGGDFANVPRCRADNETGCVVTWVSYRATSPPPTNAIFGRPQGEDDVVAACNNPAGLDGGRVELTPYFPANPSSGILGALGAMGSTGAWVDPDAGEVTTPFVTLPGLVAGECVTRDGFNYLEVTVNGDPSDSRADDIRGDLTPAWGLHLIDVSLVMGDIIDLVAAQTDAYLADR